MLNFQNKERKVVLLAVFLIFLTVVYGLFIHDLLAVSWQRFVDFFFYLALLLGFFLIIRVIYRKFFKYLNLSETKIKNMDHLQFVNLVYHLCSKMGYDKIKVLNNSVFDISYEYNGNKFFIFCYHKKRLDRVQILKDEEVVLISDYVLEPYELDQLDGSKWKLIDHDKFIQLLNDYLI
ncbi:hypothetical protein [Xylocopilactobacillus apis]|uniref:Uncharacterized protein n=1 Tax=Xylocopilactobacillus apis TaxID=2932183 RepID=A0AAU9CYN1_9LACO|nr:hypothetical protein [Xylocopilactobacillus apis]BDR56338.1 hypothetical protein KIMC2_09000 [Xylocopilactobacillus apis]